MAIEALPTYLDMDDPGSNLAALAGPTRYESWDGSPIGYSAGCAPLTAETELSGLEDVPRVTWGESYAMPLAMGALAYSTGRSVATSALYALGGYMAPYPMAVLLALSGVVPRVLEARARASRRNRRVR